MTAACPLALELGLSPSKAAAHARALAMDLYVRGAQANSDAALLHRLALHALRYWTPTASVAGFDGLWLDLIGTAPFLRVRRAFALAYVASCMVRLIRMIAIAGTPGAAHALAGCNGQLLTILPHGQVSSAPAELPLSALRL